MTTIIQESASGGRPQAPPSCSAQLPRVAAPADDAGLSSWVYPRDVRALVALGYCDHEIGELCEVAIRTVTTHRLRHGIAPARPQPRYCEFCKEEISCPARWSKVRYVKLTVCQGEDCQRRKKKRANDARDRSHKAQAPTVTAAQREAQEAALFAGRTFTSLKITPDPRPLPGRPDRQSYVGCSANTAANA